MQQVFEQARKNMVDGQIKPNQVTHPRLIEAMLRIPREKFVPRHLQHVAYVDEDIEVGKGRVLPEPRVLGRLVEEARILPTDIVLDIGCGTGYSTAVLAHLANTVVGIEQDKTMADEADRLIHDLDICNAAVIQQGDLREGFPGQAPYNVILVNGSVPSVPMAIKNQLADGGRLVAVVINQSLMHGGHMGTAVLVTRTGDAFSERPLFDAAVPVLAGFEERKPFVF